MREFTSTVLQGKVDKSKINEAADHKFLEFDRCPT